MQFLLAVKHPGRRFNRMAVGSDGGSLDDRPAERSLQHAQSAVGLKGIARLAQDGAIAGLGGGWRPGDGAFRVETGLNRIVVELAPDGLRIAVHKPGPEKFADQEAHAARRVEMVHVGLPVRINPGQKRRHFRKVGEILPSERDARGCGHRHQVNGEIGRAARRMQPHDAIDDRPLVDHAPDRSELIAERGDLQRPLDAEHGERIAQRRIGIDEGSARQVQAHDLHQHLVGVGRAVKGARAWRVIGLGFRRQQIGAARLAFGVELTDFRLLGVAKA